MNATSKSPSRIEFDKDGFFFVPLGIGDAFSKLHYSSCLALIYEQSLMLVDCPHPIRKMLHEAGNICGMPMDLNMVDGVALSHLHSDHCCGLEGFGFFSHFTLGKKVRVATHPQIALDLWPNHLAGSMAPLCDPIDKQRSLEDYFELTLLDEKQPVNFGKFQIECRRTIHHVTTTAFRITAAGRTIGISADTSWDPSLIEWLSKSDLIVHEINLGKHTPYEKLAELPLEIREKMKLIHHEDDFDTTTSVIETLQQGKLYQV